MTNSTLDVLSVADLYAIHQYVKSQIAIIIADEELDADELMVIDTYSELHMLIIDVPSLAKWGRMLDKVDREIKVRLHLLFDE